MVMTIVVIPTEDLWAFTLPIGRLGKPAWGSVIKVKGRKYNLNWEKVIISRKAEQECEHAARDT